MCLSCRSYISWPLRPFTFLILYWTFPKSITDPGLQREWQWLFICQWLCRFLLPWDLDGSDDQSSHGPSAHLWPTHDHAAPHYGSFWWSQGPGHCCAPNRVTPAVPASVSCPSLTFHFSQSTPQSPIVYTTSSCALSYCASVYLSHSWNVMFEMTALKAGEQSTLLCKHTILIRT